MKYIFGRLYKYDRGRLEKGNRKSYTMKMLLGLTKPSVFIRGKQSKPWRDRGHPHLYFFSGVNSRFFIGHDSEKRKEDDTVPVLHIIVRLLVTILVLLILARLYGPKQISQMNFYDYVIGITIGSLAATITINSSVNLLHGIVAIILYLLSGLFMSWLARKNMVLRRFLSGKPIVVIAKGELQWHGLKRARMNINELMSNLRYSGYFDVSEIDYAVLEPTGKLSVQPKGFARPPKTVDLNLPVSDTPLLANVMIDGKILHGNLKHFHKDEKWLINELENQGITNRKSVGLATLNEQGALSVYVKDDNQTDCSSYI